MFAWFNDCSQRTSDLVYPRVVPGTNKNLQDLFN